MGVHGLTTYLKTIPNCYEAITDLGCYKSTRTGLAIDGNALIFFIIGEYGLAAEIAKNGGMYYRFEQYAMEWLSALQHSSKMQLYMYCDGVGEVVKKTTHRERNGLRASKACGMMQALQFGIMPHQDDFLARMNIGLYIASLMYVCTKLSIPFHRCEAEADLYIATTTFQRDFFALLSTDSDFFCLKANYIPLSSIEFTKTSTVNVSLYTGCSIIQALQLTNGNLLPHLACLVGNDYVTEDDRDLVHHALQLVSEGHSKNPIELVKCVVAYLRKQTASEINSSICRYNSQLFDRYNIALAQYDIKYDVGFYSESKKDETMYSQTGISLKLQSFKTRKEAIFQITLTPYPFMRSVWYAQFHVAMAFKFVRQRLYDYVLGVNVDVEEDIVTGPYDSAKMHYKTTFVHSTYTLCRSWSIFGWIIGETELGKSEIQALLKKYSPSFVFGILSLRLLMRVENLTDHEAYAILLHLFPQTNNDAISSASSSSKTKIMESSCPLPRTVHLVSMYECAVMLCADASNVSEYVLGNVFVQPSLIVDGERLTHELEGTQPPEPNEDLLALLVNNSHKKQCGFEKDCCFAKCKLSHPEDVFGICKYDGKCTRIDCTMRHLAQTAPIEKQVCSFDGVCERFETCSFRHIVQTSPVDKVIRCHFGKHCKRALTCRYQH